MRTLTRVAERLWRNVDKHGAGGCWLWKGGLHCQGYGWIASGSGKPGDMIGTHRLSWELQNGPIPQGASVLHKCDVRRCVNPDHLFLGTQADNMADMVRKGRQVRGAAANNAKLTDDDVREIVRRHSGGESQRSIGEQFGIARSNVSMICSGKRWGHTTGITQHTTGG